MSGRTRTLALLGLLVATSALLAAGCGGDDEEATSELAQTTAPTTAPPTTTAPPATAQPTAPAQTAPAPAPAPEPEPAAPTSAPNACATARAISRLKFAGVPCAEAASVADEWNGRVDDCNTIDDPNSPEGYNRICTVQTYTCRAKRDVRSDARFVACAKGSATIRFTWAPP
jgi:hypothetical protein